MKRLCAKAILWGGFTLIAFVLAGCASSTTQTGLATSGSALAGVGNTFMQVAAAYSQGCLPTPRDASIAGFCTNFKDFAPKFQRAYPNAVDAWEIARKNNDASKANEATAVILQLSTDLTSLALQVLGGQL